MGKKRSKALARPDVSFKDAISDASLGKIKPFIMEQLKISENINKHYLMTQLSPLELRLATLEKLIVERLKIEGPEYIELLAEMEDTLHGLETADQVDPGDLVRVDFQIKEKDSEDFLESQLFRITDVGLQSSNFHNLEIAKSFINMKLGEEKEIDIGEGNRARIKITRISRKIKKVEGK